MKRTIMGLVTAGLLALGGSVGLAAPATAATANCPSGYSCQWRDASFRTGTNEAGFFSFFQCQGAFSLRTYAGVGNGGYSVSSVSNKGRYDPALYYNQAWYYGYAFTLQIGTGDANLADEGGTVKGYYDNQLNSGQFGNAPTGCE